MIRGLLLAGVSAFAVVAFGAASGAQASPLIIGTQTTGSVAWNAATSLTFNSGTLTIGTGTATSLNSTLNNASASTIDQKNLSYTFNGAISGAGRISIANSGLGPVSGGITFAGSNDYTGSTTIFNKATLNITGGVGISTSSGVLNNGTFSISGATTTTAASIRSLNGTQAGAAVTLGTNTLNVTAASGSGYAGSINGSGGLNIGAGANTQTLSGTSTYTGATTVGTGATLALTSTGSIATSSGVSLSGAGSKLDISGVSGTTAVKSVTSGDSGSGIVLGNRQLNITAASGTFAGVVSGASGNLNITGGSQTLTNANTYGGVTSVAAGATLALSGGGTIANSSGVHVDGTLNLTAATSPVSIASLSGTNTSGNVQLGANTLAITKPVNGADGTFAGVIAGTGGVHIQQTAAGQAERFTGTNTYSGTTTIDPNARLNLSGNGSVANSTVSIGAGGTLDVSGSTLPVGTANVLDITGSGTVVTGVGGYLTIANGTGSYDGVITGTGGFNLLAGSKTFTGASDFTGQAMIAAGATVTLTGSGSISNASTVNVNGTLNLATASAQGSTIQSLAGGGSVQLGANDLVIQNGKPGDTFSGVISGAGGLTTRGGITTLSGINTYTGATTLNGSGGSTLALTGAGSIAASSGVDIKDKSTFDISGVTSGTSIKDLTGVGTLELGDKALTITAATGSLANTGGYGGPINGSGLSNLVIAGGTQRIYGDSSTTFSGNVQVQSGATLHLDGALGAAFSVLTVDAGGRLYGTGTFDGDVVNKGAVQPDVNGNQGNLTILGNYTQTSTGKTVIDFTPDGSSYSALVVGGKAFLDGLLDLDRHGYLSLPGDVYSILLGNALTFTGYFTSMQLDGGAVSCAYQGSMPMEYVFKCGGLYYTETFTGASLDVVVSLNSPTVPVPEPSSMLLLGSGLLGLGYWKRRRAAAAA